MQGVGFRPLVFRTASRYGLAGWVRNQAGSVVINVEGSKSEIRRFVDEVEALIPASSAVQQFQLQETEPAGMNGFVILPSETAGKFGVALPLDVDYCVDCDSEFRDPGDRRYRYPFISCTQCGPRYSIINSLPFDRRNTTMDKFTLCDQCAREYKNPKDRRFHAELITCPNCGPHVWFDDETEADINLGIAQAANALIHGRIIAVKGIGGYHLMCDATNSLAVAQLRIRKNRPARPFAVLFPEQGDDRLDAIRQEVRLSQASETSLTSETRPIVLLPKHNYQNSRIVDAVAPEVPDLGVFLPPSPLHRELLATIDRPVVATSGNVSGQPIEYDPQSATMRLGRIAHHFLHHNRPITHPLDDGVQRDIAGKPRWLRVARGSAPRSWSLPFSVDEPIMALGGHLKSTVTLASGTQAVTSPHLGDLDSAPARELFAETIEAMQSLHGMRASRWITDAHPDYGSSRWAANEGLTVESVWHHHAHASALAYEADCWENLLVFTWDGVGLGPDGQLWGGETFYGKPGNWERVAFFKPFHIVGANKAGREPWRSAAALCWQTGTSWEPLVDLDLDGLALAAWTHGLHRQSTTAVGRLFDAAAALLLDCHYTSYEAEGGLRLESLAEEVDESGPPFVFNRVAQGWEIDWSEWIEFLKDPSNSIEQRASAFHTSLAKVVVDIVARIAAEREVKLVGLTGGVFQNRVLSEQVLNRLSGAGVTGFLPTKNPCNDGGLSLGQLIEVVSR